MTDFAPGPAQLTVPVGPTVFAGFILFFVCILLREVNILSPGRIPPAHTRILFYPLKHDSPAPAECLSVDHHNASNKTLSLLFVVSVT